MEREVPAAPPVHSAEEEMEREVPAAPTTHSVEEEMERDVPAAPTTHSVEEEMKRDVPAAPPVHSDEEEVGREFPTAPPAHLAEEEVEREVPAAPRAPAHSAEEETEREVPVISSTRANEGEIQTEDPAHSSTRSHEEDPAFAAILLGDYEVTCTQANQLGKGGFGRVFRGKRICDVTDIAVKIVDINRKTRTFIDREYCLMRECVHENIVKLFHFERKQSSAYFVMEYCRHGNLNKFMKGNSVTFEQGLNFMINIATAVRFLHEQRFICHRDIKPDNILVTDAIIAKLADFGLARDFNVSSYATGSAVGTHDWLPPEFIVEHGLTRFYFSADIFPLGLLFMSMISLLQNTGFLTGFLGAFKGEFSITTCTVLM